MILEETELASECPAIADEVSALFNNIRSMLSYESSSADYKLFLQAAESHILQSERLRLPNYNP